jgi:hypothetical protein
MVVRMNSIKADLDKEAKGDWIEYPDWPGVAFNVSSLLHPTYRIERDLLGQRLARQYKGGKPIPPDVMTSEVGKLFHKHILHGWRGFDVDYSKEKAGEMLADPEYRNLVGAVEWCAAKISDVDVEFVEDTVKNSKKLSAIA